MNKTQSLFVSLLVGALPLMAARPAAAQSNAMVIEAARAQIENINPDSGASLLVRVLDRRANATVLEQTRAWTLLGIAELMRNRPTVARQAFRRALERLVPQIAAWRKSSLKRLQLMS